MKKLLILGLILGLCGSLVGCGKMSDDEIAKCSEIERQIEICDGKSSSLYERLIKRFYSSNFSAEKSDIEGAKKDLKELDECRKQFNELRLNDLRKYHDFMVEYKGSSQIEEDYLFVDMNYKYLKTKRRLAYSEEIESYLEDDELSSQELTNIRGLRKLNYGAIPSDDTAHDENLKTFQYDLDELYGLNSQELYDIEHRKYDLRDAKADK